MTDYRRDIPDAELKALLEEAPLRVASLDDLAHLADRLGPLDEWVHTMETTEQRDGRTLGRLDLSMLGLDGEDDWEVPLEPSRMRALLAEKIAALRADGGSFHFDLWFGEAAD